MHARLMLDVTRRFLLSAGAILRVALVTGVVVLLVACNQGGGDGGTGESPTVSPGGGGDADDR